MPYMTYGRRGSIIVHAYEERSRVPLCGAGLEPRPGKVGALSGSYGLTRCTCPACKRILREKGAIR